MSEKCEHVIKRKGWPLAVGPCQFISLCINQTSEKCCVPSLSTLEMTATAVAVAMVIQYTTREYYHITYPMCNLICKVNENRVGLLKRILELLVAVLTFEQEIFFSTLFLAVSERSEVTISTLQYFILLAHIKSLILLMSLHM